MIDCETVLGELTGEDGDPRVTTTHVRCRPGDDAAGTVLLVGVVHDHPASVYRVEHVLERTEPATLAVELPPLSVPLFRLYARDGFSPPRLGGEMSMAILAAGDARVVGIDAPNAPYLGVMARRLLTGGTEPSVARRVLRDVFAGSVRAVACRLASLVGAVTPLRPRLYTRVSYETSLLDDPAAQAAHEAAHLDRHEAFVGAVETPPVTRFIDGTREATMADRIGTLRRDGDVVAVVGFGHLDPLAERIADRSEGQHKR